MTGREETHTLQVEFPHPVHFWLARVRDCDRAVREALHAFLGAVCEPQERPIYLDARCLSALLRRHSRLIHGFMVLRTEHMGFVVWPAGWPVRVKWELLSIVCGTCFLGYCYCYCMTIPLLVSMLPMIQYHGHSQSACYNGTDGLCTSDLDADADSPQQPARDDLAGSRAIHPRSTKSSKTLAVRLVSAIYSLPAYDPASMLSAMRLGSLVYRGDFAGFGLGADIPMR